MIGFLKAAAGELSAIAEKVQPGLQSAQEAILPVVGALNSSIENAPDIQSLYRDPETGETDYQRIAQTVTGSSLTLPGIQEMMDKGLADPQFVAIFEMAKNDPKVRSMLMDTGVGIPIAAELEDKLNTQRFQQMQQATLKTLHGEGVQAKDTADEAKARADAIHQFRKELDAASRFAKDKVDIDEAVRRAGYMQGPGTKKRLQEAAAAAKETMAKPGLHIIHKNLNLAKRKEMGKNLKDLQTLQEQTAQSNYQQFSDVGQMFAETQAVPGPEKINKTQRVNIGKALQRHKEINDAIEQAKTANKANVFDMLVTDMENPVGLNKKTIPYIVRDANKDGGVKSYVKKRVRDILEGYYPMVTGQVATEQREKSVPMVTVLLDIKRDMDENSFN